MGTTHVESANASSFFFFFFWTRGAPKGLESAFIRRWVQNYKKDLKERENYSTVRKFCTEHPRKSPKNAIKDRFAADEDRQLATSILAPTGDSTTWGNTNLHRRDEALKIPPMEVEDPQADKLEGSRAIPMARDSGGKNVPLLRSCCSRSRLHRAPASHLPSKGHRATLLLPPATTADQKEQRRSVADEERRRNRVQHQHHGLIDGAELHLAQPHQLRPEEHLDEDKQEKPAADLASKICC